MTEAVVDPELEVDEFEEEDENMYEAFSDGMPSEAYVGCGGIYLSEGLYIMPDGGITSDPWGYDDDDFEDEDDE